MNPKCDKPGCVVPVDESCSDLSRRRIHYLEFHLKEANARADAAEARVKALTAERNELKTALVPLRKAAAVSCVNADNQSSLDRINGRLVVEEFRAALKLGGE